LNALFINGLGVLVSMMLASFFSAAEAACSSLNLHKLKEWAQQPKKFYSLTTLFEQPQKLVAGLFIGHHLFTATSIVLAFLFILDSLSYVSTFPQSIDVIIATLITSLFVVFFSEMLPRSFALKNPEKTARICAVPIKASLYLLTPFIWVFNAISFSLSKVSGSPYLDHQRFLTANEIKNIVNISEKEGGIETVEKEMIHSIFDFSETVVREIMTPRTDVVSIPITLKAAEAIAVIQKHGHSRIPVYEDDIDNMIGVLYAKDLLNPTFAEPHIKEVLRPAVFIPETQNSMTLLHDMKKNKFHLAIVVDEYGGISGVVTLEDIIEEIIGDVQDEYDNEKNPDITEIKPGHYLVDAGMNIDDVAEHLNCVFPADEDFDTIGGFVLSLLGKFPEKGEEVQFENLSFKVKDITKRRIISLEIQQSS
jgi:putative hemolysin